MKALKAPAISLYGTLMRGRRMDRSKEWFEQAERDWDFGKPAASTWQYERADFIAQQSAEKAV